MLMMEVLFSVRSDQSRHRQWKLVTSEYTQSTVRQSRASTASSAIRDSICGICEASLLLRSGAPAFSARTGYRELQGGNGAERRPDSRDSQAEGGRATREAHTAFRWIKVDDGPEWRQFFLVTIESEVADDRTQDIFFSSYSSSSATACQWKQRGTNASQ